jgi:hypothetical protein
VEEFLEALNREEIHRFPIPSTNGRLNTHTRLKIQRWKIHGGEGQKQHLERKRVGTPPLALEGKQGRGGGTQPRRRKTPIGSGWPDPGKLTVYRAGFNTYCCFQKKQDLLVRVSNKSQILIILRHML